ncbi:peptidase S41 [Rickettsiella grylli]|uniref:S41 family peptidase n=1 Tax=Rickettsiella grylli TaxID=59196 RepID=UPI0008FD2F06|nr:S41 family peptidase [Rickettsiella grylli]OJA00536.1 peptidase S41 [Rickettsiella grylli]
MKLKIPFFFFLACFLLGFSSAFSNPAKVPSPQENKLSQDVLRFNRELEIIKNEYVQKISEHDLLQNAMQGMASGLDPHSSFLDADDLKDLKTATTGEFSGLGLEVGMEEGLLRVVTPIDDGPAQKAGIKPGDWIIRINNTPIQGLSLREAVRKMRGRKGSSIQLTLIRQGQPKPRLVHLKRGLVHIQSIKGHLLEPGYAYIRINSFQASTRHDLDHMLKKLQHQEKTPIQGLILDLRNNPGGLLTSAAEVTNAFLDAKTMHYDQVIVYTMGQSADAKLKILAKPNDQVYSEKLVVLINQGSASGAEIVAGALQDNHRAVILGTKSFGKGSVQTVIPLDDAAALKLTTALYYTPSGRSIQASGISPDIIVDELKINAFTKNPIEAISFHESELKGHLKNDKNPNHSFLSSSSSATNTTDLLKNDYQLFEAFNLLKSMIALQPTKTPL